MAGFQVANFSFGKNIKDDERQRMQIAAQTATTRRGQDMQAAQAGARLAEDSRQFDGRMAAESERLAENTRQFDEKQSLEDRRLAENTRQFDEKQSLEERKYADKRAADERAQSWTDALNEQKLRKEEQEIEKRRVEFEAQNAQLDAYLRMKQEEDEQMENRRRMTESGYGNMAILAELQNGVVTKRQTDEFNRSMLKDGLIDEGREYNYIGTIDQTTGRPFEDGRLHFVRYALDGSGQAIRDEKSGRPLVEIDNALNPEMRNVALSTYFGNVKQFMGARGGGMSEERMQLERDRIQQRRLEEEGRNSRAGSKNDLANVRLAAAVARTMDDVKRGLNLNDVELANLQASLKASLADAFGGGEETPQETPRKTQLSSSPQENKSIEVGQDGKTYEIVRSSTGAVIGKREVNGGGRPSGGGEETPQENRPAARGKDGGKKRRPLAELDPNGKYDIGDRFIRKGKIYEVGADGQPHLVQGGK